MQPLPQPAALPSYCQMFQMMQKEGQPLKNPITLEPFGKKTKKHDVAFFSEFCGDAERHCRQFRENPQLNPVTEKELKGGPVAKRLHALCGTTAPKKAPKTPGQAQQAMQAPRQPTTRQRQPTTRHRLPPWLPPRMHRPWPFLGGPPRPHRHGFWNGPPPGRYLYPPPALPQRRRAERAPPRAMAVKAAPAAVVAPPPALAPIALLPAPAPAMSPARRPTLPSTHAVIVGAPLRYPTPVVASNGPPRHRSSRLKSF